MSHHPKRVEFDFNGAAQLHHHPSKDNPLRCINAKSAPQLHNFYEVHLFDEDEVRQPQQEKALEEAVMPKSRTKSVAAAAITSSPTSLSFDYKPADYRIPSVLVPPTSALPLSNSSNLADNSINSDYLEASEHSKNNLTSSSSLSSQAALLASNSLDFLTELNLVYDCMPGNPMLSLHNSQANILTAGDELAPTTSRPVTSWSAIFDDPRALEVNPYLLAHGRTGMPFNVQPIYNGKNQRSHHNHHQQQQHTDRVNHLSFGAPVHLVSQVPRKVLELPVNFEGISGRPTQPHHHRQAPAEGPSGHQHQVKARPLQKIYVNHEITSVMLDGGGSFSLPTAELKVERTKKNIILKVVPRQHENINEAHSSDLIMNSAHELHQREKQSSYSITDGTSSIATTPMIIGGGNNSLSLPNLNSKRNLMNVVGGFGLGSGGGDGHNGKLSLPIDYEMFSNKNRIRKLPPPARLKSDREGLENQRKNEWVRSNNKYFLLSRNQLLSSRYRAQGLGVLNKEYQ